jgi:hypothetical protein
METGQGHPVGGGSGYWPGAPRWCWRWKKTRDTQEVVVVDTGRDTQELVVVGTGQGHTGSGRDGN